MFSTRSTGLAVALVAAVFLEGISAQAALLHVDIGQDVSNTVTPQPGWQPFLGPASANVQTRTYDATFGTGGVGGQEVSVDIVADFYRSTPESGYPQVTGVPGWNNLLSGAGFMARASDPQTVTLTLSDLADGPYRITTYHHDNFTAGTGSVLDIYLTDALNTGLRVHEDVPVSRGTQSPMYTTRFTDFVVHDGAPTTLEFVGTTVANQIRLNAFVLGPAPGPSTEFQKVRNAMEFAPVGERDNPADTRTREDGTSGYGSVGYTYDIGKHHVTNAQYVEFLNAVDPHGSNADGLFSGFMATDAAGGINAFEPGSGYTVRTEGGVSRGDWPVNFVSWYDAARFTNWLTTGDPEIGVYDLASGAAMDRQTALSTFGVAPFLPTEDEWDKAAYYDADSESYYLYGTGKNTIVDTEANYNASGHGRPTDVGPLEIETHLASPYGAYDMAGNMWDWTESWVTSNNLGILGGGWLGPASNFAASRRHSAVPSYVHQAIGMRVARIPEPGTVMMLAVGVTGLLLWRRRRREGCACL